MTWQQWRVYVLWEVTLQNSHTYYTVITDVYKLYYEQNSQSPVVNTILYIDNNVITLYMTARARVCVCVLFFCSMVEKSVFFIVIPSRIPNCVNVFYTTHRHLLLFSRQSAVTTNGFFNDVLFIFYTISSAWHFIFTLLRPSPTLTDTQIRWLEIFSIDRTHHRVRDDT
jgi:hypothetical protein